jgi:hypothetical protein
MLEWYDMPNELIDAVTDYYEVGTDYALCAYLAHEYGEGGEAYLINKSIEDECSACDKSQSCSECGCGEPYGIHYMFRNLVNDIKSYKNGELLLDPDEWEPPEPQDLPF